MTMVEKSMEKTKGNDTTNDHFNDSTRETALTTTSNRSGGSIVSSFRVTTTSIRSGGSTVSSFLNNNSNKKQSRTTSSPSCGVWTSRILFLGCLCSVAAVLGWASFFLISRSEQRLADDHFDAIAERALDEALEITLRKRLSAKSLATVASYTFPNAIDWPKVSMYGFEAIAGSIIDTTNATSMGLCPLVWPDQLEDFEKWAYETAFPDINGYSNITGLRDFDSDGDVEHGVHGFDSDFQIYREVDGKADWDSDYEVVCPFIMHSVGPRILMMNLHSMKRFGKVIDELITCASDNKHNTNTSTTQEASPSGPNADTTYLNRCSILSDMIVMFDRYGVETGPAALIMQPIYPANNKDILTGVLTSTMEWEDVMANLFSTEVGGVDCVLETETSSYTYRIEHEHVILKGEGSLHDTRYESYRRTIDLYSPGLFSYTSASYKLSLYPSEDLFEVYSTENPWTATIGAVAIIIFTSLLFFLYDFFVRQEFYRKQSIIEAKRRFVRYISHEVRTPLNTIVMGSRLLQQDMSRCSKQLSPISNNETQEQEMKENLRDWTDLVSDILDNANSAVNVLSDLLNFDKVESGTLNLEMSVIQFWSLMERASSEFRVAASAKKINYHVDFKPLLSAGPSVSKCTTCMEDSFAQVVSANALPEEIKQLKVIGDAVRLSQVLRNFVSNAIKFTPEHGNIIIRLSLQSSPASTIVQKDVLLDSGGTIQCSNAGFVQIDVVDSGAGLSGPELDRVFTEGTQFNANNLQAGEGSGLGLFISKGIIEQHGGSVHVTSPGPGKGSTFTLLLPLSRVEDQVSNVVPEKSLTTDALQDGEASNHDDDDDQKGLENFRVLVVDDTKLNRKLLVRLLAGKGLVCDEAENGLIAVDLVEKASKDGDSYDTVLLDFEMPVMKGPEAAKKMRELGCDSFIVGVTGNLLPEDVANFKEHGANCVLPKPLNLSDLEGRWIEQGIASPFGRRNSLTDLPVPP